MKRLVLFFVFLTVIFSGQGWASLNDELIKAAIRGDITAVKELLKRGANVNAKNEFGETALTEAAFLGHTDTVRLLIERGADVNAKNKNGWTALMSAAMIGHTDTVRLLIERGADVNAKDNDGFTALMSAAWRGHTDTARLLIERGADVNAKDNDGFTALMLAAKYGHTDTVRLLIERGADINAKNKNGWTALDYAKNDTINELLRNASLLSASARRCVPKPGLKPELKLSIRFSEPSGNNILDGDERGEFIIIVENTGRAEACGVKIAVEPEKAIRGLSWQKEVQIGDIQSGKEVTVSSVIDAGEDIETGKAVFNIKALEANGFDSEPVKVVFNTKRFEPPRLIVADIGIEDQNGNLKIEPLENVELTVRVQNAGYGDARDVSVDVEKGENVFIGGDGKTHFELGNLRSGEFKDVKFIFYTNKRIKRGEQIPIKIKLSEARQRFNSEHGLNLVMNAPQKGAGEIIVHPVERPREEIRIAAGLSVDVDMNIPQGIMATRDDVAVVIGNKHYRIKGVPPVEFADRDARIMKEYLMSFGFDPLNIIYEEDATLSKFNEIFGTAAQPAKSRLYNWIKRNVSRVFIYYAGHGVPDLESGGAYLMPVDADPQFISTNGYSLDTLYSNLAQLPAKEVIVVIDACFSGNSGGGMLLKGVSPAMVKVKKSIAPSNAILITSANIDEVSAWYEEKRHSLFTYYFLKAIGGDADKDRDRSITLGELKAYLTEHVPYMARRLKNIDQNPVVSGNPDSTLLRLK